MIRTPFALEKMTYDGNTGMVIYRSKLHATLKRNFDPPHPCGGPCGRTACVQFRSRRNCQLLPAAQWLTLLLAHIPDKYEHLVRYYGWYSNRARRERCASAHPQTDATTLHLDETPLDRTTRAHWARLIHKVYEVDPLECPQCGSTMRILAVIDDPAVIRRILKHLRRWDPHPKEPDHPGCDPLWPAHTTTPLTYHPVPDIA